MSSIVISVVARRPFGSFLGTLSSVSTPELGGCAIREVGKLPSNGVALVRSSPWTGFRGTIDLARRLPIHRKMFPFIMKPQVLTHLFRGRCSFISLAGIFSPSSMINLSHSRCFSSPLSEGPDKKSLEDMVDDHCPAFFNGDIFDVYESLSSHESLKDNLANPSGESLKDVTKRVDDNCYETIGHFCDKNNIDKKISDEVVAAAKTLIEMSDQLTEINGKSKRGFSREVELNRPIVDDFVDAFRNWGKSRNALLGEKIKIEFINDDIFQKGFMGPLYNIDFLRHSLHHELRDALKC